MHVLRRERQRIHVDRARRIECARVKINLTKKICIIEKKTLTNLTITKRCANYEICIYT